MCFHRRTIALCVAFAALCAASLGAAPAGDPLAVVGIGRGTDYGAVTRTAVENAGGLDRIVKKGDVVLIKPNLCTNAAPGRPTTTDYRVVQAVVDVVKSLGAGKVIVAEGGFYGNCFSKAAAAMSKYDTIKDVTLYDLNGCDKQDCYQLSPKDSLIGKALYIPKVYIDANVVITVAKMKTHFLPDAVVSLSLKNVFGVPPDKIYGGYGDKSGLHSFPLKETIVELNKIRKPDFSIVDGIVGGEGWGPANNTPVDSRIIVAGADPVAVDTVALSFMGFTVDQVPHVKLAAAKNLGIADLSRIKVTGADLDAIRMDFKSGFKD